MRALNFPTIVCVPAAHFSSPAKSPHVNSNTKSRLPDLLKKHEAGLLEEWLQEQKTSLRHQNLNEADLRGPCMRFLQLLQQATRDGSLGDLNGSPWQGVRDMLTELSRTRCEQGFSPSQTAMFLF